MATDRYFRCYDCGLLNWYAFKSYNHISDDKDPKERQKVKCPKCNKEYSFSEYSNYDEY